MEKMKAKKWNKSSDLLRGAKDLWKGASAATKIRSTSAVKMNKQQKMKMKWDRLIAERQKVTIVQTEA
jgi:hypothetical protein